MMDMLSDLINRELPEIKDSLVMKDGTNYYLYDKYIVLSRNTYYKVISRTKTTPLEFTTLKNAIAWCVLDHNKKYYDAKQMHWLDLSLLGINSDIVVHKNLVKKDSNSFITINKLQESFFKRRQILEEIRKLIEVSKKLQEQKFSRKGS